MADKLSATPRSGLLGFLADTAKASYSPQRTQQMQGLMQFFGAPDVAATLDRLSYGEPLTTGKGWTTQMRPETVGALMAATGAMPSLKGVEAGAATVGRAIAPSVEKWGMRQVEAGTPIGRGLVDLAQGSRSSMIDPAMARAGIPNTKAVDAAGNPVRLYRGGNSEREPLTFGLNEGIGKTKGTGITLSSSPDVAATYATGRGNVAPAYVDLKNPMVIDAKGKNWNELGEGGNTTTDQLARYAQASGHDGIIFRNLVDQGPAGKYVSGKSSEPSDVYTVFNQADVRSAISDEGLLGAAGRVESDPFVLAQQRAALPIEQGGLGLPPNNTPMDRAKAMGATDVYHGTASDVQNIDKSMFGSSTGSESAKKAFFVTDDPSVTARSYAEYAAQDAPVLRLSKMADDAASKGDWDKYDELVVKMEELEKQIYQQPLRGQNIMPMSLLSGDVASMNAKGAEFSDVEGGVNNFLKAAMRQKADAAKISNLSDAVGRVDVPATHYAVFNPDILRSRFAAFDPFRRNAAIAAAMGVAAPNLLAKENK